MFTSLWRTFNNILSGEIFVTERPPKIEYQFLVEFFGPEQTSTQSCYVSIYEYDTVHDLKYKITARIDLPATPKRLRIDRINGVYVSEQDYVYKLVKDKNDVNKIEICV